MKVRVTTPFNDAHTKKLHKVGEEMEVSVDRVNEILKVGNFIQIIEEETIPELKDSEDEAEEIAEPVDAGEEQPKAARKSKNSSK